MKTPTLSDHLRAHAQDFAEQRRDCWNRSAADDAIRASIFEVVLNDVAGAPAPLRFAQTGARNWGIETMHGQAYDLAVRIIETWNEREGETSC
jgi:hypothetical protein